MSNGYDTTQVRSLGNAVFIQSNATLKLENYIETSLAVTCRLASVLDLLTSQGSFSLADDVPFGITSTVSLARRSSSTGQNMIHCSAATSATFAATAAAAAEPCTACKYFEDSIVDNGVVKVASLKQRLVVVVIETRFSGF